MTATRLDESQRRSELLADLLADGPAVGGDGTPAWMHRPSTLRRVATELARTLPAHFDRIVAVGAGAETLGTALSLATGVGFGTAADPTIPGEDVVVIAAEAHDARAHLDPAVTVVARRTVWARTPDADALFLTPRAPRPRTKGVDVTDIADDIRRITTGPALGRLHPEIDPAATRSLAAAAARSLRDLDAGIEAISCWTSPENVILAFAVAEELGLPAVQLSEDEGLLYLSWELRPSRIAFVAAANESARQVAVAQTMLAGAGHSCVASVSLTLADGDMASGLVVDSLTPVQP